MRNVNALKLVAVKECVNPDRKVRLLIKLLSSQLKQRRSGNGNGRVQRQESYVK